MTTIQYHCTVKSNSIQTQDGHFFKVAPFEITVEDKCYKITFERRDEGKVFHVIYADNQEWLLLTHPDYVPDCSFDDLNTFCKNPHAQTIFYALCKAGVAIKKDYLKWIDDNNTVEFTYDIKQYQFI